MDYANFMNSGDVYNGPNITTSNLTYEYIIDNLDNNIEMTCNNNEPENITNILNIRNGIMNILNDNNLLDDNEFNIEELNKNAS